MATARYDLRPRQMRALLLLLVLLPLFPTALVLRFMFETVRAQKSETQERLDEVYSSQVRLLNIYLAENLTHAISDVMDQNDPLTIAERITNDSTVTGIRVYSEEGKLLASAGNERLRDLRPELPPPNPPGTIPWRQIEGTDLFAARIDRGRISIELIRDRPQLADLVGHFYFASLGPGTRLTFTSPQKDSPKQPVVTDETVFGPYTLQPTLPGWTLRLVLPASSEFEKDAKEQAVAFAQLGAVVVFIIIAIASLAGIAIGRQLKLHELRNNALAAVAHELKTPVASTRLLVDTLLEGRTDAAATTEYLQLIATENQRIARIIESFLMLSRMEQKEYRYTFEESDPADLASEAVDVVRVPIDEQGFAFRMETKEPLPLLLADQRAVVTMLANILENAIKYSDARKEIRFTVESSNGGILYEIADRGIGISPDDAGIIFLPFRQADNRLARTQEGVGLGLSIVRNVVKAHRGKVSVRAQPGGGSIFSIWLPAAEHGAPSRQQDTRITPIRT